MSARGTRIGRHRHGRRPAAALVSLLLVGAAGGCGTIRDILPGGSSPTPTPVPTPSSSVDPNSPSLQPMPSLTAAPSAPALPTKPAGFVWHKDAKTGLTFAVRKDVQFADPQKVRRTGKAPSNWRKLAKGQDVSVKTMARKSPKRIGLGKPRAWGGSRFSELGVYVDVRKGAALPIGASTRATLKRLWRLKKSDGRLLRVVEVSTPMGSGYRIDRTRKAVGGGRIYEEQLLIEGPRGVAIIGFADMNKKRVRPSSTALIKTVHR